MSEGMAAEASKIDEQSSSWVALVWAGSRQATIAIAIDLVIYCFCLAALMICYFSLKVFHWLGYPPARIAFFETLHFWAYWLLNLLFAWDLIIKSAVVLVSGWKNAKRDL